MYNTVLRLNLLCSIFEGEGVLPYSKPENEEESSYSLFWACWTLYYDGIMPELFIIHPAKIFFKKLLTVTDIVL